MVTPNLPVQPTAFVGRTEELAEIINLLDKPDCRLLTLVGPGGIGKTRLALEAASTLFNRGKAATDFPEKVYFIPLQPLTSPDFILSALAEAVGFQFYPGSEPLLQLIDFLCPLSALLIFDNFEHLLDGVGLVSEILGGAPAIKLLSTSRETLNLQEEWLYQVKGMPFPETERDDLEQFTAIRFFVQSARRVRPNFSLDAERQPVFRICQLVEGMPLALEMTAAWLKRLPIHEIVQELEHGLDILENPARNAPARHRSMRAVFDHSWHLLADAEGDVFKKLSVFRGGFRKEAAEAVAGATRRVLSALVDKSLLRLDNTGRYDLHELLRQYAEEQLNASPEVSRAVHDLHCRYYAGFLVQRPVYTRGQNARTIRAEIDTEFKNLRSAWEWAIEQRDLAEAGKIIAPLGDYYNDQCLYQEGEEVFRRAVLKLRGTTGSTLLFAMQVWGRCLQFLCRFDEARAIYEELLSIARQRHDLLGMGVTLLLSEIAIQVGDYQSAKQLGEECLDIQWQLVQQGDRWGVWDQTFVLANLGRIAGLSGDYVEAKRLLQDAIVAAEKVAAHDGIADARNILGNVELATHAYQDAKQTFGENLVFQKNIDYPRGEMVSLVGLGEATRGLGDYAEARQYFSAALNLAMQIRGTPSALDALTGIADLLMHQQNWEPALQLLAFVLRHRATSHDTKRRAQSLFAQLQAQLPSKVVAAAIERGKSDQLDAVVRALLDNQLSNRSEVYATDQPASNHLTEREREILRLMADGLSNQAIAERLFLTVGTVKWYSHEIYAKLHASSRTQAIIQAKALNLLKGINHYLW
ncbi:MAG: helix-turn-helix transcriptional regulator [Aggregatilineales bacterium]